MNGLTTVLRRRLPVQRIWNGITRFKFAVVEPLTVQRPDAGERIGEVAFKERYPEIPISGLVVADRIPRNEVDMLAYTAVRAEEWLAGKLPAARGGQPSIEADPHRALDAAYSGQYRKLYRPPSRPPGYDGDDGIDLARVAVESPYAYLLEKHGDRLRWNLAGLDGYELHRGLRVPRAVVHFEQDGAGHLRATQIHSELGWSEPGEPDWHLAQRLAMCAAATHITLVRHFNWIHLVCGERFALATNRLPSDHVVRRLLAPHVYATHIGNRLVTPAQLAPGGDFECLFSYTHAGLCALFEHTAAEFDLRSMHPSADLERRRIDDLPIEQQPALENRLRLMRVITDHVARYVGLYYERDADLHDDNALGRWIEELSVLRGVKELAGQPTTERGLITLISTLIYMVAVEHEIVDSNVWDYHLWSDVSAPRIYRDGRPLPTDVYQRLINANFILNVERTLLMTDFSYLARDERGRGAFRKFRRELRALQRTMDLDPPSPWRIEPRSLKANINY